MRSLVNMLVEFFRLIIHFFTNSGCIIISWTDELVLCNAEQIAVFVFRALRFGLCA